MDAASQYALAYALTTTAGVRAVLSLAGVAVAVHFHVLHPPAGFTWLGSQTVMWILIGVAVVEFFADKIPLVDHTFHFVQIAAKPAAGAILVGGSVHAVSHETLIALMVAGGLNALGIHSAVMTVRGASTLTTAGAANPAISLLEDAGAIGALVLALLLPFVAAALAVLFTLGLLAITAKLWRFRRQASTSTGSTR
jgi:hypothetical protein